MKIIRNPLAVTKLARWQIHSLVRYGAGLKTLGARPKPRAEEICKPDLIRRVLKHYRTLFRKFNRRRGLDIIYIPVSEQPTGLSVATHGVLV